jgi:hypothetical protein
VAYAKPPFGGPAEFLRYVGRYTHRVGLSNRRIVALDDEHVTFKTRGESTATLLHDEFLRRFLLHVLPDGFTKIRHYGLFAPGKMADKLALARQLLAKAIGETSAPTPPRSPRDFREILLALTGVDILHCATCRVGVLVRRHVDAGTLATLALARGPPDTS